MATVDLNQLPRPMWWKNWTMKPFLRTQGDAISLYPEDQQEAIARTLTLESEPIVKLLQENAYREVIWRQRVNEAAQAVTLAYSAGRDLDVVAGTIIPTPDHHPCR
jgi:phage-related baseplate assembly protein